MNPNLLTTIVLRQHLQRAYDEMGEELWPILQRIIKDLMDTNIPEDRQRHDHETWVIEDVEAGDQSHTYDVQI